MKLILPLLVLFLVVIGCVAPPSRSTKDNSSDSQAATFRPTIEYTKPKWETNEVSYTVNFEVRNTSNQDLKFVQIHASFYDKNGEYLKTEEPFISRYTNLGVGQRSAGTVMTEADRRIKSVRLEFTCNGEESFSKADISATEVAKL